LIDGWTRTRGVLLATLAPELPGAVETIAALAARGVIVSIGHTDCTAAEFAAGRAAGATYVTHLFNAMRPFSHRDPGPIGAALGDDTVVAGLICDGIHVDPVAVRMAWRALGPDRLNLVTDAVAVLGSEPGESRLGAVEVTVGDGGVRTADGVLAGSDLSLDRAVRNLVSFTGCSVPDAVTTVTATPARLLGLADRGRLAAGARADVTILDAGLAVVATIVGGEVAWRS
jgi:N-acetylglucosamine-6-phosphate deacetylase